MYDVIVGLFVTIVVKLLGNVVLQDGQLVLLGRFSLYELDMGKSTKNLASMILELYYKMLEFS